MPTYEVKYQFEAGSPEEASHKATTALYLAEIDATVLTVGELNGGEFFKYPFTQKLVRSLSERQQPAAEGDWGLQNGTAGGDID